MNIDNVDIFFMHFIIFSLLLLLFICIVRHTLLDNRWQLIFILKVIYLDFLYYIWIINIFIFYIYIEYVVGTINFVIFYEYF
jgi:hypothetical protein